MNGGVTARVFLLTGPPGCGKTTLLRDVLARLDAPAGGFYTEEVRQGGRRTGFRLVTLDGRQATLASTDRPGAVRVGRYSVDLAALDGLGVPALEGAAARGEIVVIDEIGKMEMASPRFRRAVESALEGDCVVLGTILLPHHPWADAIKAMPDVLLVQLGQGAHGAVADRLTALVRECLRRRGGNGGRYIA